MLLQSFAAPSETTKVCRTTEIGPHGTDEGRHTALAFLAALPRAAARPTAVPRWGRHP